MEVEGLGLVVFSYNLWHVLICSNGDLLDDVSFHQEKFCCFLGSVYYPLCGVTQVTGCEVSL